MKSENEKVPVKDFFYGSHPKPASEGDKTKRIIHFYNNYLYSNETERKMSIIKNLFGSTGADFCIEQPFYCHHGYNIHIGENFYANGDCSFVDIDEIRIGNDVLIGANVGIYTCRHHMDFWQHHDTVHTSPVHIGNSVWIGGGVIIFPGVTIGDNVIISPGSVVVHDVPPNVIVSGNPAKIEKMIDALYEER